MALKFISVVFILLAFMSVLFACTQERMLFFPSKLPKDYTYGFGQKFEELFILVDKQTKLNGLLFRAEASKGLVFYLHGNAGALDSWGDIAPLYLKNHYDFFILDYRAYGKSDGRISSEKQLYRDIQIVYDSMKNRYLEKNTVIIGYSIGTGLAAHLASQNKPKLLILKAPYFNLPDLAHQYFKFLPSFLIRYKFYTNQFITQLKCPLVIFHGDRDEVIYTGSSLKLQALFKKEDRLVILKGQTHNGINENPIYMDELERLLR